MVDTPRATSVPGVPHDGVTFPYVSGPTLRIDPRLQLRREWREWTDNIDPSTSEVVRHGPGTSTKSSG